MKRSALITILLIPLIAADQLKAIDIHNISLENSFNQLPYQKSIQIPDSVKNRLEEEIKKSIDKETTDFDSDAFFSTEPARLVGFIRGYSSDTIKSQIIYTRSINSVLSPFTLTLFEDGYFEADIKLEHPKMISLSLLKSGEVSFYIEPGHTLAMILNWEDVLNSDPYRNSQYIFTNTEFAGSLADVNQDLLKRKIYKPGWHEKENRMNSMSPTELLKDIEDRINNNLEALRKIEADCPLHPKAKRLIENEIKADALSELLDFDMNYLRREFEKGEPPITNDYYGPLSLLTDDRGLLVVLSGDQLISSLNSASIFFRPGNLYRPEFKPDETFGEYLETEGKVVSEELTKYLPVIQETLEAPDGEVSEDVKKTLREKSEIIQQLLQDHINEFMDYQNRYTKQDLFKNYTINLQKKNNILKDSLGIDGILKDVTLLHNHLMWQNTFQDLPEEDVRSMTEELMDLITNLFIKRYVSEKHLKRF